MRAMCTYRKLELKKKLVGDHLLGITGTPDLPADLAKLAWPVSEDQRPAGVVEGGVGEPFGLVETRAKEPAAGELIIARNVIAERPGHKAERLLGARPDELR